MLEDLQPALDQYGRLPLLEKVAERTVQYFDELPPEFGGVDTEQNHAAALEALAGVRLERGDTETARRLFREALALRQRIFGARPDDAMAGARLANLQGTQLYWGYSIREMDGIYAGMTERLKAALAGEPHNTAIKRWLANALACQSFHLSDRIARPSEALAAGTEAVWLWRELLAASPRDSLLRAHVAETLTSIAIAHERRLEHDEAVQVSEESLGEIDRAVRDDPMNIGLLEKAAQTAMMLSYRVVPLSVARSREAELVARERWRGLTRIDPSNAWYRHRLAWAHMMECAYLQTTGEIPTTREAFARFYAMLAPLAQYPDDFEKLQQTSGFLGQLAADAGDFDSARAHLQTLHEWHRKVLASLPAVEAQAPALRVRRLFAESWILEGVRDWPELERVGRELLAVLEEALTSAPADAQFLLDRAYAGRLVGLALLRSGYADEAVPVLKTALHHFHTAPAVATVLLDRAEVTGTTRDTLAEALAASGDHVGARRLLEENFTERETQLAARPELWPRHQLLARTALLLAAVLDKGDPRDAATRRELRDRAIGILTAPDVRSRLTAADRELLHSHSFAALP